MARISVREIRSQVAHGGSPKGVFALGSNLTGGTSPARLGWRAVQLHLQLLWLENREKSLKPERLEFS